MACRILPRPEHLADARAANDDVYRRLAALPEAAETEPAATPAVKTDRAAMPNVDQPAAAQSQTGGEA